MTTHGHFHWNELATRNVEKAKTFYGAIVGWTFAGMPMPGGGTYWLAKVGDMPVAGLFDMTGMEGTENIPEHWLSYLAVDDVDARVKQAVNAGATLLKGPFDVPEAGRIAILKEPTGAVVGWMTPIPM
jgi:predicted enzyme related to lactoylglutathione lyase